MIATFDRQSPISQYRHIDIPSYHQSNIKANICCYRAKSEYAISVVKQLAKSTSNQNHTSSGSIGTASGSSSVSIGIFSKLSAMICNHI